MSSEVQSPSVPPTASAGSERLPGPPDWPGPDGLAPLPTTKRRTAAVDPNAILILVAVTLFVLSDLLVAGFANVPVTTTLVYRNLVYAAVAIGIALWTRDAHRPRRWSVQGLRGLFNFGAAGFFIASLQWLDTATATAISFASPAIVTMLAIPLLGERVRARRAAATLVGLLGVLVVARPGSDALGAAALLPLASAACGAGAILITRKIGSRDTAATTTLVAAAIGLVLSTALALSVTGSIAMPNPGLLLMGGLYAAGQTLLVIAYRRAESSYLAPFSYAQVPIAAALTVALTAMVPPVSSLIGMTMIVAAGAYTLLREGRLAVPGRREANVAR